MNPPKPTRNSESPFTHNRMLLHIYWLFSRSFRARVLHEKRQRERWSSRQALVGPRTWECYKWLQATCRARLGLTKSAMHDAVKEMESLYVAARGCTIGESPSACCCTHDMGGDRGGLPRSKKASGLEKRARGNKRYTICALGLSLSRCLGLSAILLSVSTGGHHTCSPRTWHISTHARVPRHVHGSAESLVCTRSASKKRGCPDY